MGHVELLKTDQRRRLQGLRNDGQGYGGVRLRRDRLGDPGIIPDDAVHNEATVSLLAEGKVVDEGENIALEHDSC